MGKVFYEQVVLICRKYLKISEENKKKNDDKFKFQGQSIRSQRWFDIHFDSIKEVFSAREPVLYKKIYQRHDETQDINTFKMFVVPIGNAKNMEEITFIPPLLKYCQNTSDGCCFSSLALAFESINLIKAANAISKCIEA